MKTKYRIKRKIITFNSSNEPIYRYWVQRKFMFWWFTIRDFDPIGYCTNFHSVEEAEKIFNLWIKYKDRLVDVVKEIEI